MAERIYIRNGNNLEPMEEQRFALEAHLQELLAEHPDLIDGEQVSPGNPRRWLLVKREMGVPAAAGESDRWSLDHLFVDQDARPTLVEVKLGSNTEVRREVVGQMMDYAANASQFWTKQTLIDAFKGTCARDNVAPETAMREFLAIGSDQPEATPEDADQPETDAFWDAVATNLAAKNLRLLFVADAIPIELARIVEFLNAQMRDNIEVLAVEVKQFQGKGAVRSVLVPNVIGHTARLVYPPGSRLTRDSLLAGFTHDAAHETTERLLNVAEENGATLAWGKTAVSIRGTCPLWNKGKNPISLAWVYRPWEPAEEWRVFMFGTNIFAGYVEEPDERLKKFLVEYAQKFENDTDAVRRESKTGPGVGFRHECVTAQHADAWAKRIADALDGLRSLPAD